jgi:hypothetical protein
MDAFPFNFLKGRPAMDSSTVTALDAGVTLHLGP